METLARLRAKEMPEAFSASILLVGSVDSRVGLTETLYQQAQRDGWLELRGEIPRKDSIRLLAWIAACQVHRRDEDIRANAGVGLESLQQPFKPLPRS